MNSTNPYMSDGNGQYAHRRIIYTPVYCDECRHGDNETVLCPIRGRRKMTCMASEPITKESDSKGG